MFKHSWAQPLALTTLLAITLICSDAAAMGGGPVVGQVAHTSCLLRAQLSRSEFMEDTPKEIALENRANPWQAWALAFFPTAIVKGVTLGLAFAMADEKQWAVFLPMIPSMGISHFWETRLYWAGFIALAGDIAGSALITYYWSQVYSAPTVASRPSQTMLWAGIGVLAVFWIYENITAPLFAGWYNSKLRKQFLPKGSKHALAPSWRSSPLPSQGLAQIGPPMRQPVPVAAGYAFSF